MNAPRMLLFPLILIFAAGCASTSITGYKDPDFANANYKRIMVVMDSENIGEKMNTEELFVEWFAESRIPALEHYKLFPPTREITAEHEQEVLMKRDVDAILVISPRGAGYEQSYSPPVIAVAADVDDAPEVAAVGAAVAVIAALESDKPWSESNVKLYESKSGRCVWMATSFTSGNGFASMGTVSNSFAQELVDRLIDERLVTPGF